MHEREPGTHGTKLQKYQKIFGLIAIIQAQL